MRRKDRQALKSIKKETNKKQRFTRLKAFYNAGIRNRLIFLFVLSMADMLIIETLARHSLIEGVKFMVTSPLVFLFNCCFIFVMYAVGLLIRRQVF